MPNGSVGGLTHLPLIALVLIGCANRETPHQELQPVKPEMAMAQQALLDARRVAFEDASAERGMSVAIGTAACRAASCFSCYQCHGIRGVGSEGAGFPRLAGQSYDYLVKSLGDFASRRRPSPAMQAVASSLTEQQMRDVAAYYAALAQDPLAQTRRSAAIDRASPELISTGARIASQGSSDGRVLACSHCHGSGGVGKPPLYPSLAGQYANYLERQLRLFRSGQRTGSDLQIMEELARRMSDEQILAVAEYFGSLPIPTYEQKVPSDTEGSPGEPTLMRP